jgi:hypothetical protein
MRRLMMALALACASLAGAPAQATEKAVLREGLSFPATGVRVLVMPPDIAVASQSMGGMEEPNAEWTDTARRLLNDSLVSAQSRRGVEVVQLTGLASEDEALLAEYRTLLRVVASQVQEYSMFAGNRIPTKRNRLDWSVGPGAARLGELAHADYAVFLYTHDAYGSTGRKVAQLLAGGLLGVGISSGVHVGYAGLVDLRTGDLLWVNADAQMGGDVRDAEGAARRVEQLLEDYPIGTAPRTASGAGR